MDDVCFSQCSNGHSNFGWRLLVLMMNLNHIAGNVEKDVEVRAHIDNAANDDDIKAIGKQITEINGIESVIFSKG